ncbi:MAG: Lin1244/Lin1753 domain-containing protein, partial [Bacteroides graminisolvens]
MKMGKKFYFKHDASAFSDAKLMSLIKQEGMTGYGIYWIILEFLRMQREYVASYVMLSHLSRRANTSSKRLMRIISDYDLFVLTDDYFYSPGLSERMAAHDRVVSSCRAHGRLGGLAKSLKISQSVEANALALQRESNHIITSLKSESEANSCSSPEELLRSVAEMKHETIWQ